MNAALSGPGAFHCHASCCSGDCDRSPTCRAGAEPAHRAQLILDRYGYPSGYFGDQHDTVLNLIVGLGVVDVFCECCETANARSTTIKVMAKDGRRSEIASFACRQCGYMWKAPAAAPVYRDVP